jgi:hypothetical protein
MCCASEYCASAVSSFRRQIWFRSAQPWITEIGNMPRDQKQQDTSHLR